MTPDATGRFCSVCTKSVHDFTDKPKEELLAFLLCSTSSPCVRMLASQETFTPEEVQTVVRNIVRSGKSLSVAALALVTLFATGCQSESRSQATTSTIQVPTTPTGVAAVTPQEADSPQRADTVVNPAILGRMIAPKAASKPVAPDPEPMIMGEPAFMGAPPEVPPPPPALPEIKSMHSSEVPEAK
ncbi:MAG: hypothetical protein EOP52_12855 [Sphingobacteriales bacterium]|nr:MAG: hypothetical protein EOP52_12855 [Sphingobacteriales bacterium]